MRMLEDWRCWSERCDGKPVLLADIENWCATEMNLQRKSRLQSQKRVRRGLLRVAGSCYSNSGGVFAGTGVAISRMEAGEAGVSSILMMSPVWA